MPKDKNKVSLYNKEYYQRNKEKEKERARIYRENNPERVKVWSRQRNKEVSLESTKRWRENNRDHIREYNHQYKKEYLNKNPERVRELKLKSYYKNKEKYKEYRILNSGRINSHTSKRRALQISRIPKSSNINAIIAIYEEAKRITQETGISHHVDHIVPLQGKLVSGLHAEWNLQIIPAKDNLKKSNKFIVEVRRVG